MFGVGDRRGRPRSAGCWGCHIHADHALARGAVQGIQPWGCPVRLAGRVRGAGHSLGVAPMGVRARAYVQRPRHRRLLLGSHGLSGGALAVLGRLHRRQLPAGLLQGERRAGDGLWPEAQACRCVRPGGNKAQPVLPGCHCTAAAASLACCGGTLPAPAQSLPAGAHAPVGLSEAKAALPCIHALATRSSVHRCILCRSKLSFNFEVLVTVAVVLGFQERRAAPPSKAALKEAKTPNNLSMLAGVATEAAGVPCSATTPSGPLHRPQVGTQAHKCAAQLH